MLYPLIFQPIFQERIWGGRNLERLYKKRLPRDLKIGESWEVSDRAEAQSVVQNGPFAGKTLHWLMENYERDLLGKAKSLKGRFPLLVKILDAEEKLSLQVHPPAGSAAVLGGEAKTEMWYITQARPGAELFAGLKAGTTRGEFEAKIQRGEVAECFHRIQVHAGDAMYLPSGRVHAIGGGLVIFEIQQNSDTTYRVFDWNRKDVSGKPRPLHVRESLECIDFTDFEPQPIRPAPGRIQKLVDNEFFKVELINLEKGDSAIQLSISSPLVLGAIEGTVRIGDGTVGLKAGEFCLLPACLETITLESLTPARVLVAEPG